MTEKEKKQLEKLVYIINKAIETESKVLLPYEVEDLYLKRTEK